jgi:hypothetical protein
MAATPMKTGDRGFTRARGDERLVQGLKGFRVEWTDGVTGIADGVVLLVRTVGLGSGRSRLESVPVDDVERIVFDERRIVVRAREPSTLAVPRALWRVWSSRRRGT